MILTANSAVQAAAAAVESEEAVTITTAYSGVTVPTITIVMVGVSVLLLAAAGIAGMFYVLKRFKNWGPGVISGILAQILFCFLLYVLIMLGISKIPAMTDAATERTTGFRILEYCITMVLTISGVYAGIRYAVASGRKKMMDMNVGLPLAFGMAFLIASLMEGDTVTYPFQYIMISLSVNQMGFDPAVASMVEGGLAEEQAVEALLQLANADWFAYLCESLSIICSALINTCAAVIFFGVYEEKLQKSWLAYAFGGYLVFWIPGLINLIVTLPTVVILAVMLVLTAAVLYFTKKALTSEMPEAWEAIISKPQSVSSKKKTAEPPKMPKIKMPD